MNKIVFILVFFILINFANAEDQKENLQNSDSAAKVLSDNDKVAIKNLMDFIANQPKSLKEEIYFYRAQIAKLRKERQHYYQDLSAQAKDFLTKESDMKNKLSVDAKNEFYSKNSVLDN